jgi:hypothetical protein
VLSLARSTMFSSTTLSSSSRSVHFARPRGGDEQAKAISLASLLCNESSRPRSMGGLALRFRVPPATGDFGLA